MDKKSVSASLLIVYLAALFAVVGSCFYNFIFKERQIKIENVLVEASANISVFNDKEKSEKCTKLNLSEMKLGIRPATGEIDKDTQIPSTINNESTSEGYYASVFVDTTVDYKILIKDINIETKQNELEVKEERKNIFISILDVENTTKSLEDDEIELVKFEDQTETKELVFLIWLGALADDVLQGANISFVLEFRAI